MKNIFDITPSSTDSEITDAYHYGGFNISKLAKLTGKTANELITIVDKGIIQEELADIHRRQEVANIFQRFGINV